MMIFSYHHWYENYCQDYCLVYILQSITPTQNLHCQYCVTAVCKHTSSPLSSSIKAPKYPVYKQKRVPDGSEMLLKEDQWNTLLVVTEWWLVAEQVSACQSNGTVMATGQKCGIRRFHFSLAWLLNESICCHFNHVKAKPHSLMCHSLILTTQALIWSTGRNRAITVCMKSTVYMAEWSLFKTFTVLH